jgi:SAM-dependent methyltransferase/uncharacterized protein YbaR (Trm112 family)
MREKLLEFLGCPECMGEFSVIPFKRDGAQITEGILECRRCGRRYPVINSIPRILPSSMINRQLLTWFTERYGKNALNLRGSGNEADKIKERTARSFGFQWNAFREMYREYERNFLDYISPLKPSFFRGKTVLDAGCGFGRHTYYAAKYGSEVVGFDLSDAVDAAYENCRKFGNVHIVQADIYNLPFRRKFDFIMSIGVLHHLPRPEHGYLELVRLAKEGSLVLAWLYGKEGRAFKTVFLEGTIRKLTVSIPQRMLYYFCYLPAILYHTANQLYKFLNRIGARSLAGRVPFRNYAKFPFRVKLADAYDFLGTPVNNYYTKEECEQWLRDAGLKNPSVTSLGGRSWRLFGRK